MSRTGCFVVGLLLCAAGASAQDKPAVQDAPSVKFGARLQGWYQRVDHAAPDGTSANDFLTRRAYVYVNGTLPAQRVSLFAHVAGDRIGQQGLDNPGAGLGTGIAVRDAWVAWEPSPAFRMQAGRMYVPFTRAFGTESTFTLLSTDLPATQGGGRGALFYASKVGRDDGVVVWGTPLAGRLQYRVGIMEGVEGAGNPSDAVRLSGRVALQLLEPETTWFNRGTYLGTKRVLAFGVGVDRQNDLVTTGRPSFDSRAWTIDAFFDHPIGEGAITVEASVTAVDGLTQPLAFAGLTPGSDARLTYVNAGYLVPGNHGTGRVQVFGRWERTDGDGDRDTTIPTLGVTYLVRGHDLKVTLDWSRIDRHGARAAHALTVQFQAGI
jgi:hypothetical protein